MSGLMTITVHDDGADDERLDALATALRQELMALDVEDVEPLRDGEAPPGARAVELAAVGALLVIFKESAELVKGIVTAVRSWMMAAPPGRSVEITVGDATLKVASATVEQQDKLIIDFLDVLQRVGAAHSDPPAS